MNQILIVFVAATATALATGLGALPFAFRSFRGERLLGVSNALAAGVMLGASASLIIEGADAVSYGSASASWLVPRSSTACSGSSITSAVRTSVNCEVGMRAEPS